jgi:hypothetical protein
MKANGQVKSAIEQILLRRDFSLSAADALVSAILQEFPEDQRFEDILDVLAQYRPGGGEFLFDEKKLESECKRALMFI